jgi:hypothetical protein
MVHANSRALRLARMAETRRNSRNNPGVREAENKQQRNRQSVPEYREQEQSVNTERQAAARKDEEVRERENEQRCNRWLVSKYREQEQSFNMHRRAVAREAPGVRENEATNRAAARAKRTYDIGMHVQKWQIPLWSALWFMEHTLCSRLRIHPPFKFNAWDKEVVLCKWSHVN